MATLDAFVIPLDSKNYPTLYEALRVYVQGMDDERIAGRQGQASLAANLARYMLIGSTLTQNIDFGGFRAINGGTPVNPGDYATKAFVEGLAFGSALPNISGSEGKALYVRGGVADWGWRNKWTTVSASGAVAAGSSNAVDTSVSNIVLALPTTPVADMHLQFKDDRMNAAANPFYLDPGATEAFEDLANGVTVACDYNGVSADVAYINGKWRFVNV